MKDNGGPDYLVLVLLFFFVVFMMFLALPFMFGSF